MKHNNDISKLIDEWTPEAHWKAYNKTPFSEKEAINKVTLSKLTFPERIAIDKRGIEREEGLYAATDFPHGLALSQKENAGNKHRDYFLRGASKYLPFTADEQDEAGAFLARNLTCIFKEGYKRSSINVYINKSNLQEKNRNIVHSMENQLNFYNEISIAGEEENAEWVIEVDPIRTDPGSGLYKLYARTYQREKGKLVKSFTTFAYIDDKSQI